MYLQLSAFIPTAFAPPSLLLPCYLSLVFRQHLYQLSLLEQLRYRHKLPVTCRPPFRSTLHRSARLAILAARLVTRCDHDLE